MSKVVIQGNASGTGDFTLAAPNSNTDRTLTLPDETGTVVSSGSTSVVTQTMLAANVVSNGAAFSAKNSGTQSLSGSTYTKMLFATEEYDTNSNFASSRFTPTVAGYYQMTSFVTYASSQFNDLYIYKNGSNGVVLYGNYASPTHYAFGTGLMYLNGTTDYAEIYGYASGSATSASFARFQGVMVRSAV